MTDYLIILINLILIWAINSKKQPIHKTEIRYVPHRLYPRLKGQMQHLAVKAAVSEKMAHRAFQVASAASLGVIALQKTLPLPRLPERGDAVKNHLASKEIDKLFTKNGSFELLKPILDDESLDFLDKMERDKLKEEGTEW